MRPLALRFSLAGLIILSACITPPPTTGPAVIPEDEFRLVSTLTTGQELSQSGRVDLAEIQFRKALALGADLANVYNNLGFVLQSQGRYEEALGWYRKAVEREPRHVIARENTARVLYQLGQYRAALLENLQLLDIIVGSEPEELRAIVGEPVGNREIVDIYRNLSQIYLTVGVLDDAICYSGLAFAVAQNMFEAGRHARLLLSLDKTADAVGMLRMVVITNEGNVPPKVMVDYGIALYLQQSYELADTSATRVLTSANARPTDRRLARLIRILVAQAREDTATEELVLESVLAEDPELCEATNLDPDQYWPLAFLDKVEALVRSICSDGSKRNT